MRQLSVIAAQEIRNGLRNFWVGGAIALMLVFSLTLALLGSAPGGEVGVSGLSVLVVSLASLTIFLLPLIALLLGHDAIAGEAERGTLALTLSCPVSRRTLLLGKFLGHFAILALAATLGFGAAAITVLTGEGAADGGGFADFLGLLVSALLMGAAFLALGTLASVLVRERMTAVGLAIGIWLVFVIVWDLALLGILVAWGEVLPEWIVSTMILLNPADVFRLLNLTASEATGLASGIGPAGAGLAPSLLWGALLLWLAAPLALAIHALDRKEIGS
ncbi:MAG: ABC transporter permease subunit [Rhodothalassiaceae bacterium]